MFDQDEHCFCHRRGFLVHLYRWIMNASLLSSETASYLHIQGNNSVSFPVMGKPIPYRPRQELHLHLDFLPVVELLFLFP